jgi:hypothetical protein
MFLTRYDQMNRPEMRVEIRARKLNVYMNANSLTFRQALIQDDVKKGINPYRNSSSPSDDESPLLQQRLLVSVPSLPSASSVS